MGSLIFELQRDALDSNIRITDLLRKALLVSRKLKIEDLQAWLSDELNGYGAGTLPTYRMVTGELKAFNPYQGWIPVMLPDELHKNMTRRGIFLAVSQIENLVADGSGQDIILKYPGKLTQLIMRLTGTDFESAFHVPIHNLVGMLDVTRTKIMEFALDLEDKGVVGKGIVFTKDEQQIAQTITYNTINIHRMENSQIQQATDDSDQYS